MLTLQGDLPQLLRGVVLPELGSDSWDLPTGS